MDFEWDESKNEANIRKHKIDFEDIPSVFDSVLVVSPDNRMDYGEHRWIGLGLLGQVVVLIVFSEPKPRIIRIISARKANRKERKYFYGEIV